MKYIYIENMITLPNNFFESLQNIVNTYFSLKIITQTEVTPVKWFNEFLSSIRNLLHAVKIICKVTNFEDPIIRIKYSIKITRRYKQFEIAFTPTIFIVY